MKLLTPAANNVKMNKGRDLNIEGAILHLSPADKSGYNTCPYADTCKAPCLDTSGHGRFDNVQEARIRKTRWFFEDRPSFMAQLVKDVEALTRKATKSGKRAAVRLNGTSDIGWSHIKVTRGGQEYRNIFTAFPEVQFYDYSKVPTRQKIAHDIPNYHVTFSLGGTNDVNALDALAKGGNVAVVLRVPDNEPLPKHWSGYAVVDGTAHDYRFLDPQGSYIVALRPKGDAKKDTSGFVRDLDSALDSTRRLQLAAAQG